MVRIGPCRWPENTVEVGMELAKKGGDIYNPKNFRWFIRTQSIDI